MEIPPLTPVPPPTPPSGGGISENQWSLIIHLSGLAGLFTVVPTVGNILAPLILWLIKKEDSPLLDQAGKDVLNFQITYTLYMIFSGLSVMICIGYVLAPVIFLAWLIFTIIGAIKASEGVRYTFPLTIKFLS